MAPRHPADRASPGCASLRSRVRDAIAPPYPLRRQSVTFPQISVKGIQSPATSPTGPAGSTPSLPRSIRRVPGRENPPRRPYSPRCSIHRTRPLAATSFDAQMAGQRLRTHPRIAWVVTHTERDCSLSSFRAPPGITARLHYPTRPPRPMTLAVRGLPEGFRRHPGGIAPLRHTSHRHVSLGRFRASQCIPSCTGVSPMHSIGRLERFQPEGAASHNGLT